MTLKNVSKSGKDDGVSCNSTDWWISTSCSPTLMYYLLLKFPTQVQYQSRVISVYQRPCLDQKHAPALSLPNECTDHKIPSWPVIDWVTLCGQSGDLGDWITNPTTVPREKRLKFLARSLTDFECCNSGKYDCFQLILCNWAKTIEWLPWNR